MYFQASHSGQQGQVVIVCVENPYSDTADGQLLGKLEAQTDLFKVQSLKPGWTGETQMFQLQTFFLLQPMFSATLKPWILLEVGPQTQCNVVIFHHSLHVACFGVNVLTGSL